MGHGQDDKHAQLQRLSSSILRATGSRLELAYKLLKHQTCLVLPSLLKRHVPDRHNYNAISISRICQAMKQIYIGGLAMARAGTTSAGLAQP